MESPEYLLAGQTFELPLSDELYRAIGRAAGNGLKVFARVTTEVGEEHDIRTRAQLWLVQFLSRLSDQTEATTKQLLEDGFPANTDVKDKGAHIQKLMRWAEKQKLSFIANTGRQLRSHGFKPLHNSTIEYCGQRIQVSEIDGYTDVAPYLHPQVDYELPDLEITRRGWDEHAACKGLYTLFQSDEGVRKAAAKLICESCTVRELCYDYAVQTEATYGVWAGVDFSEVVYLDDTVSGAAG